MEDIKQEIYEQDAIDEKIAIAEQKRMEAQDMKKCSECGYWVYEEDLYNGLCENCIDDIVAGTTPEEVIEYARVTHEQELKTGLDYDSELQLYTEYLFTRDEVLEILKQAVKDACKVNKNIFKNSIKNYIECDVGHYIDYLDAKGAI